MSTIARVGNLKIQVFADDHFPWHCHIVSPDFEMLVDLGDLSITKGTRYRRHAGEALAWIEANLEVVRAEWNRLNER
jgi:hypothetical protein